MSIQNYEEAKRLIEESGDGDFEGIKPLSLVVKAEAALGIRFPPSYRRFLLEMGCGDIRGMEVFGLIDDSFEKSTVPNGVWVTLSERKSIALNPAYIIIADCGDGGYYAFDTRETDAVGENPIVRLSMDGTEIEKVAESFGSYFLGMVDAVL